MSRIEGYGTAGTTSGGVVSVQGVAGGTIVGVNVAQWNGVAPAAAAALGDAVANPTVPYVGAFGELWDGAQWVRAFSDDDNTDGVAGSATTNKQVGLSRLYGYDAVGAVWSRLLMDGSSNALVKRGRMTPTWVVANGAANTATTLTIAASGAGLFHAITYIHIARVATAALAGTAVLAVTTTNLSGNPQWRTGNVMVAGGFTVLVDQNFGASPLRSSVANTATTIVAPAAGAAVSWQITVAYFDTTSQR